MIQLLKFFWALFLSHNIQVFAQTLSVTVNTLAGVCGTSGSAVGSASSARFNEPQGLVYDSASTAVILSDTNNNCLKKVNLIDSSVSVFAGTCGSAYGTTNGPASSAVFNYPHGLALDPVTSTVYVLDRLGHCVRKVYNGQVSSFAGVCGTSGTDNGAVSSAKFYQPFGVAWDASYGGSLVVADTYNNCIRRVVVNTLQVSTIAGSCGAAAGQLDAVGSNARFNVPQGVGIDSATGDIYVTDTFNHCVRKILALDATVTSVAGLCGTSGNSDGTGNNVRLSSAWGMTWSSTNVLFVSDFGNHCIRRITTAGVSTTIAGTCGTSGTNDSPNPKFYQPGTLVTDKKNSKLYEVEFRNYCVRQIAFTCSSNYVFDFDSHSCVCSAGTEAISGTCTTCSAGYYKSSASSSACTLCPLGTESTIDRLNCTACTYGRVRSTSMTSCSDCPIGFEAATNKSVCIACTSGYYRPSLDYLKCIICPSFASCSSSAIISCQIGYKINSAGNGCEACPIGTQQSGDYLTCVNCNLGTTYRSSLSQSSCQTCPSNSNCLTISSFTCNAGYEPNAAGTGCSQCQEGYSKASSGNVACGQCSAGTESASDKQSCVTCASGKYRPNTLINKCMPCPQNAACTATSFTCNPGYKLNTAGDGCDQCPIGQHSNGAFTACVSCTSGTNYRSSLTQTTCQACPSNSACATTGFTCYAGYEPTADGTACQQCQDGYAKASTGNAACSQCSIGTESASDKQSCVTCGSGKYRPSTVYNKCIQCPPNGVCLTAALSKCIDGWKINSAGDGCEQCPLGQESDGLTCTGCSSGYIKPDQTYNTCIQCPQGYSSCGGSSITCQTGYFFDQTSRCKRNDTYFAFQNTATATGTTVTEYLTVTQTSTNTATTTTTIVSSIYLTASIGIVSSITVSQQTATVSANPITVGQTSVFVTVTSTQANAPITETNVVYVGQNAESKSSLISESIYLEGIGVLPISPLIFGIIVCVIGAVVAFVLTIACCRPKRSRVKDINFDPFTSTATNTTGQRTFTTNSVY